MVTFSKSQVMKMLANTGQAPKESKLTVDGDAECLLIVAGMEKYFEKHAGGPVDIVELYKRYQELKSVHRVAGEYGVCGETIRSWLKKAGCKVMLKRWTKEDLATLRDYYLNTKPEDFSVKEISRKLGRPYFGVAIKAGRLGLGNYKRPKRSRKTLSGKQGEFTWDRIWKEKTKWKRFPHPRGFLGGKHTEATRETLSKNSLEMWDRMKKTGTGLMSDERRQNSSDLMSQRNHTLIKNGTGAYSRCKRGWRSDLGEIFFRSAWEANYARYLNFLQSQKKIAKWEYEVDTFWFEKIRRGVRSYTPDFKVWGLDGTFHYEEVKGWMDNKSKTKLRRMGIYHPSVKIIVVDEKRYNELKKTASKIIKGWE